MTTYKPLTAVFFLTVLASFICLTNIASPSTFDLVIPQPKANHTDYDFALIQAINAGKDQVWKIKVIKYLLPFALIVKINKFETITKEHQTYRNQNNAIAEDVTSYSIFQDKKSILAQLISEKLDAIKDNETKQSWKKIVSNWPSGHISVDRIFILYNSILTEPHICHLPVLLLDRNIREINKTINMPIVFLKTNDILAAISTDNSNPAKNPPAHRALKMLSLANEKCFVWTYPLGCVDLPFWPASVRGALNPPRGAKTIAQVIRAISDAMEENTSDPVQVHLLGFADRRERNEGQCRQALNLIFSRARVLAWRMLLRSLFPPEALQIHEYWFGNYFHNYAFNVGPGGPNPYRKLGNPKRSLNRRVEIIVTRKTNPWHAAGYTFAWDMLGGGVVKQVKPERWTAYKKRPHIFPANRNLGCLGAIEANMKKLGPSLREANDGGDPDMTPCR